LNQLQETVHTHQYCKSCPFRLLPTFLS
jgi:hypothetical protein